jgi:phosphate transport system permease protein
MAALVEKAMVGERQALTRRISHVGFDRFFRWASLASALLVLFVLAGIIGSMIVGGWPAFREAGLVAFVTGTTWDINADVYGAWPAIAGTLATALIALVIGVPVSLGIAIFLTQYAPRWLKGPVGSAVELLAAVPSIIYGMWGLFVFAPLVAAYLQTPLNSVVEGIPIVGSLFYSRVPSGTGIMTAGIILAIMIIPFVASITRDMLDQIPSVLRESAYGIGCTTWEVVRHVLIPQAGVSIIGAIMLGLGRDHGGHLRGRQCQPPHLALRSGLDHRLAHRQRVQRGPGAAAPRPHRPGLHPVPRHLLGSRRRALSHRAGQGPLGRTPCHPPRSVPLPRPPRPPCPGGACAPGAGSPTAP